jgi:hypothetical protein
LTARRHRWHGGKPAILPHAARPDFAENAQNIDGGICARRPQHQLRPAVISHARAVAAQLPA